MQRKSEFGTLLMYMLLVFLCVGFAVLMFLNYRAHEDLKQRRLEEVAAAMITPTPAPTSTPAPTPAPERNTNDITLAFGGDMVGQVGLTTEARKAGGVVIPDESEQQDDDSEREVNDGEDGEEAEQEPLVEYNYDYAPQLEPVKSWFESASLAACTLTGTLMEAQEYESYQLAPSFAEALGQSGFDIVNTATGHALDYGFEQLQGTVGTLNENGLTNLGTFADQESFDMASGIVTKVVDGVSFAFLSYTWETGGMSAANNPYAVNILTTDYMSGQSEVDYERRDKDLARAKELGASFIVTFLCWSSNDTYYTDVRESQSDVVDYLCRNGADIIVGGGLRVSQPMEIREVEREDGSTKKCVVAYGLGNLLNCMNDSFTNLSALMLVDLKHDVDNGEIWIDHVSYRPLFMLDTDDYDDIEEDTAPFKYRLFDIYDTMELFDNVNNGRGEAGDSEYIVQNCITRGVYEAMKAGAESLKPVIGTQFDVHSGGVSLYE